MTKALTPEEADKIVPRAKRKQARQMERKAEEMAGREQAALNTLRELGGQIVLYEPSQKIEEDELRGIKAQFVPGTCHVRFVCATDSLKHKGITGVSAVHALDEAESWLRHQEKLKPEFQFQIAREPVAPNIVQRPAGDTQTTAVRRRETERRVLTWQNGHAEQVDAQGAPQNA
jgi:hypothetical protein